MKRPDRNRLRSTLHSLSSPRAPRHPRPRRIRLRSSSTPLQLRVDIRLRSPIHMHHTGKLSQRHPRRAPRKRALVAE